MMRISRSYCNRIARDERGEGPTTIILGVLVLAIAVLLFNYLAGCISDTREERKHGKKVIATPTPTPITEEPGAYEKTYRPGFEKEVNPR